MSTGLRGLLREAEIVLETLLKQMQAHVPDADVIGLRYDEFTGTASTYEDHMATDQTPSDIEICFMATEADEELAAIRTRLEASMKEAGAGYFGKKARLSLCGSSARHWPVATRRWRGIHGGINEHL